MGSLVIDTVLRLPGVAGMLTMCLMLGTAYLVVAHRGIGLASLTALWLGGVIFALGNAENDRGLRGLGIGVCAVGAIGMFRAARALLYGTEPSPHNHTALTDEAPGTATPIDDNAADDTALVQYKQILCSVLPPEFLSAEGLLRTAACASQINEGSQKMLAGGSEEIRILSPRKPPLWSLLTGRSSQQEFPPASYEGALAYKILRHHLEKYRAELDPKEYEPLSRYITCTLLWHGGRDVIDVRSATHKGVLAHEAFHDIQGFLYDNHPGIVDALFAAIDKRRLHIEDWYNNIADSSYRGPLQYTLSHFFPNRESPLVNPSFGYDSFLVLCRAIKPEIPSRVGSETISRALHDIGRNELLPVLICAASEGDDRAAEILAEIFGEAGLNKDFYATLPRV
jgi:hypothetical protein